MSEPLKEPPGWANWMSSLWLFTVLRFGMFFALWGLLLLVGMNGYLAAVLALLLSMPLSFVLLAKPRARVSANIEARMAVHREVRRDLDSRLDPEPHDD